MPLDVLMKNMKYRYCGVLNLNVNSPEFKESTYISVRDVLISTKVFAKEIMLKNNVGKCKVKLYIFGSPESDCEGTAKCQCQERSRIWGNKRIFRLRVC